MAFLQRIFNESNYIYIVEVVTLLGVLALLFYIQFSLNLYKKD